MESLQSIQKTIVHQKHALEWHDWHWQMANRIREGGATCETFPMAVTPYYASLIEKWDATDPVFRMAVPQAQEMIEHPHLVSDPLEEDLNRRRRIATAPRT
jgi:lysine 2,3-aminomutase